MSNKEELENINCGRAGFFFASFFHPLKCKQAIPASFVLRVCSIHVLTLRCLFMVICLHADHYILTIYHSPRLPVRDSFSMNAQVLSIRTDPNTVKHYPIGNKGVLGESLFHIMSEVSLSCSQSCACLLSLPPFRNLLYVVPFLDACSRVWVGLGFCAHKRIGIVQWGFFNQ